MDVKWRWIVIVNVVLLAAVIAFASRTTPGAFKASAVSNNELRDGDILFQTMTGGQSDAIALATRCKWTHVGIAFKEIDGWMVYEAVGPVKRTPLGEWIEQGRGHYVVKRWNERANRLGNDAAARLRKAADHYMGLPYDWQFLWSDERIYCSELVWKMYAEGLGIRLCEPKPLKDYQLDSELVQRTMTERYGSAPPLNEPMVAPATLFECALLSTVLER